MNWWTDPVIVAGTVSALLLLWRAVRPAETLERDEPVDAERDGVDEWGGFSPHEFMLLHDEVYAEIDAATRERVAWEVGNAERERLALEHQERADVERGRLLESARDSLKRYRRELEKVVAERPEDELVVGLHAATVQAAEGYVDWLAGALPWQLVGRRTERGEYLRLTTPPDEFRYQLHARLTKPWRDKLHERWEREEAVEAEAERRRIVAEAAERVDRHVLRNGLGEVVRVIELADEQLSDAERDEKVVPITGRARRQRERDDADHADDGRLNGSTG